MKNIKKKLQQCVEYVENNGKMSVAHFTGVFQFNAELRKEFYKLIDLQGNNDVV